MRLVYDIETDGLLNECTTIHCIVALNLDSGTVYNFTTANDQYGSIADGIEVLKKAELLVGHNVIGFDGPAIKKISGVSLAHVKTHDTFIMSQVLRYNREHKHGLGGWGQWLGYKKFEFDDFSSYSKEMLDYCIRDVHVNKRVYDVLLEELKTIKDKNPLIAAGLRIEHDVAQFNVEARTEGWNFDEDRAASNLSRMQARMEEIESKIHPLLGNRTVYIDKEPKTPKFKKDGTYTAASHRIISEYLGRTFGPADTPLPAGTQFQRSRLEPIELGNLGHVKDWLLDNGWVPDEYQKRKVGWEWVTTGPKLTSSSLKKMGEIGEMNITLSETEEVLLKVGSLLQVAEGFTEICGPLELLHFDVDTRVSLIFLQSLLRGEGNCAKYLSLIEDKSLSEQTAQEINSVVSATMLGIQISLEKLSTEISINETQTHLAALDRSLSLIFTLISSELGMLN